MSHYLNTLIARSLGPKPGIRPRLASRFESWRGADAVGPGLEALEQTPAAPRASAPLPLPIDPARTVSIHAEPIASSEGEDGPTPAPDARPHRTEATETSTPASSETALPEDAPAAPHSRPSPSMAPPAAVQPDAKIVVETPRPTTPPDAPPDAEGAAAPPAPIQPMPIPPKPTGDAGTPAPILPKPKDDAVLEEASPAGVADVPMPSTAPPATVQPKAIQPRPIPPKPTGDTEAPAPSSSSMAPGPMPPVAVPPLDPPPRPSSEEHSSPQTPAAAPAGSFQAAVALAPATIRPKVVAARPQEPPPARATVEAPTIRVSIGRIEVRAVAPPPPAPRKKKPSRPAPALSLDDYLKRYNGGRS